MRGTASTDGPLPDEPTGAITDRRRRRVIVSDELDGSVAAMRLAHELAHLRMHKLSRDSGCHGLARLEAESVAYTMLARFGVLPAHQMASAAGTIGRNPSVRLVETLGGRVVATAGRLIGAMDRHLPTPQVLPGKARTAPMPRRGGPRTRPRPVSRSWIFELDFRAEEAEASRNHEDETPQDAQ